MKTPKRINLNPNQVADLLKRVENSSLQQGDYEIIKAMAEMTAHGGADCDCGGGCGCGC